MLKPKLVIEIPKVSKFIFTTTLKVRISDINYGNHLGHDSLISLLHEARVEWLKSLGYSEIDTEGCALLLGGLAVNYAKQVFYGDELKINLGIGEMSSTSFQVVHHVELVGDADVRPAAKAVTIITCYDLTAKKVAKIPEKLLARLS